MNPELRERVGEALGAAVVDTSPVNGGSINECWHLVLDDGLEVFAKTGGSGAPEAFEVEADGLGWLSEARAIHIPEVLATLGGSTPALLLQWIQPGRRPGHQNWADLGRRLAALHAAGAESFGYPIDNLIATVPQPNGSRATWAEFYAERRLVPMTRAAFDKGTLDATSLRHAESLAAAMSERVGPPEPPARLHGDLWSGNLIWGEHGHPVLVDPAVYGGHREVDLAMMKLFGGFEPETFAAYDEVTPLADGAGDRTELYQLYPLLVHAVIFGGTYVQRCAALLARLA